MMLTHQTHIVRLTTSALAMLLAITTVTLTQPRPAAATFPGANGRIAFNSDRTGNDDVFTTNATGTQTTNLSATPSSDRAAEWSPDGRRVVYTRTVAGNIDIYVKTVATGRVTRITTNRAVDVSPAWSPNGRRLVFVSNRLGSASGGLDLYLVRATREGRTNRPVRISNTAGDENNPDWSANGGKIAFDLGLITFDVYVIGVNGRGRRAVTDSSFGVGRSYFDPTWSPDGSQIAFDNGDDIFRIAAGANGGLDCAMCTNLTAANPDSSESDPSWSPNSRQIAFVTTRDRLPDGSANHEVYVMSAANGAGQTNITQNPAQDDSPAWGRR
jgi:Tol biopolymer transport system component